MSALSPDVEVIVAGPVFPSIRGLGLVRFAEDGSVVDADATFAALIGREASALIGQSYWALTAPGQKQRELNHLLSGVGSYEKEFLDAKGAPITATVFGGCDDDGTWFAWVERAHEVSADDARAVERTLRHQNAILLDLAQNAAVDAGDLDGAMRAVTEAGAKGLRMARSSVWLYGDGERKITCCDLYAFESDEHSSGFELFAKDFPGYFAALAEDRSIAANDARHHPATREFADVYLAPLGITSMLEAPIRQNGKLLGVLCSEHIGPVRTFTQEEQNFAAAVADYVGRALQAHERAKADAALRELNAGLERLVAERTASLQVTLDSMGDALVVCTPDGTLLAESSKAAEVWFGPVPTGDKVWAWLGAHDPNLALALEVGFEEIVDDIMPLDVVLAQLPGRVQRGEATFALHARPVLDADGGLERLVLVLSDITSDIARERSEAARRELPGVVGHLVRDREGFAAFVVETERLLGVVADEGDGRAARLRALHTLKGNASIYGFRGYPELCHQIEDQAADGGDLPEGVGAVLASAWREALEPLAPFLASEPPGVRLTVEEHARFLERLKEAGLDALADEVAGWTLDRAGSLLQPLIAQAERLATSFGKAVEVQVEGADVRLDGNRWRPLLASLVHVVRNAVDHGLETPEQREASGKAPTGRLAVSVRDVGHATVIEVQDDGAGVDWQRVRSKARDRGLAHETDDDLRAALWADGLSTRDDVTTVSGRGVGLASAVEACSDLGGRIEVESRDGAGCTFRFVVPVAPEALARVA